MTTRRPRIPGLPSAARWAPALAALLLAGCSTLPRAEERTWLVGHQGMVLHGSLAAVGPSLTTERATTSEVRVLELELYGRYNFGGFLHVQMTPELWRLEDAFDGHDVIAERSGPTLGLVYTLPLLAHLDVSARVGATWYQFRARELVPPGACPAGATCAAEPRDLDTFHGGGAHGELRLSFPVSHYRAGLGLVADYHAQVPFPADLGRPIRGGTSFGLMFHLLGFSSEAR